MPQTLFDKIWDSHIVTQEAGSPAVLYIDLHLVHEVTSPQAFQMLRERGLAVRRPDKTVATVDHSIPTHDRSMPIGDALAAAQMAQLATNCHDYGIPLYDPPSGKQGVVHVIGPEQGHTQPGMTIVCGDSHTATHGAFGALAFGIGTSEVAHVLATQCLLQAKPRTLNVEVTGRLAQGVSAKDLILDIIARIGVSGGTGHVIEYTGAAIRALSMEQRMTVCNMSIEGGARAGLIAPDDTTYEYLAGRPHAPQGADWDAAVARWRSLTSDADASWDQMVTIDAGGLEPMITYGTNPGMAIPITGRVPDPAGRNGQQGEHPSTALRSMLASRAQDDPQVRGEAQQKALTYMDLRPGQPIAGQPIDVVFIGSCTNGRLSDLHDAARIIQGRRVHPGVRVLVAPGSQQIKAQAEAERLDVIFREAGCEWREPGCSMCIAMNGDQLAPGQYAVSTSNRNFEGRQGPGGRTFLASPLTAAASAVMGCVTDPRTMI